LWLPLPQLRPLPLRALMRTLTLTLPLTLVLMLASQAGVSAHVGSPDVYFEGSAGPYRLLVAIRAPAVVPGIAEIEVRVLDGIAHDIRVVPLRLTGPGAVFAPVPDRATPSDTDPRAFRAGLWMMVAGPWQVRITVDGEAGSGSVSVPVDVLASRTLRMDTRRALLFLPLGLFLVFGFVAIVGASVGAAQAEPGQPTPPARRRRAWIARGIAFVVAIAVLGLGNWWWEIEARAYDDYIYKPLELQSRVAADGSLRLALHDPGWLAFRVLDDLVPDHGHTMHLFAVRTPDLDRLLHLHPSQLEPGSFSQGLPAATAAGRYRLFADVVHATGLPETAVADMTLPASAPTDAHADGVSDADDSVGEAPAGGRFEPDRLVAALADGGHMTWTREAGTLKAKQPYLLTFRVDDRDGSPARDLALYMGMPGHAIVLRRDLTVFAHVHPYGTAPMASLALTAATPASSPGGGPASPAAIHDPHTQHAPGMSMPSALPALPPTVSFPYGFPQAGDYRLFVQVKRGAVVQTGVFDVRVD
jgi:hypothetical protein